MNLLKSVKVSPRVKKFKLKEVKATCIMNGAINTGLKNLAGPNER